MENKKIIIILVAIVIVLAAVGGIMFLQTTNTKEPCKITIMGNKTISEGDSLSIKLTDLNKTPISKQIVNVTITNSKGKVVVDDVFKTNSKGVAKINLDLKKGKYVVNASYGGNQNYSENNTSKNITITEEEKTIETNYEEYTNTPQTTESYPSSQDTSQPSPLNEEYYQDEYGIMYKITDFNGEGYEIVRDDGAYVDIDNEGNILDSGNIYSPY